MSKKETPDDSGLPRALAEYFRDGVELGGLPIPFADYVVPQQGSSAGDRLGNTDKPLFTLRTEDDDEWLVIETSPGGYPVAMRTASRDAAVAATLTTRGDASYNSAILGYSPDIGTFAMAVKPTRRDLRPSFKESVPCYADACAFKNLERVLTSDSSHSPLAIIKKNRGFVSGKEPEWSYDEYSPAYVWMTAAGHNPWAVIEQMHLETFETLLERYKTAASAIGRRFNTTPPDEREIHSTSGNPDKARELMGRFSHIFEDENKSSESDSE